MRDIAGMLKAGGADVDRDYIARWAADLDVLVEWNAVLARVD